VFICGDNFLLTKYFSVPSNAQIPSDNNNRPIRPISHATRSQHKSGVQGAASTFVQRDKDDTSIKMERLHHL